jgi:hypothetical protein
VNHHRWLPSGDWRTSYVECLRIPSSRFREEVRLFSEGGCGCAPRGRESAPASASSRRGRGNLMGFEVTRARISARLRCQKEDNRGIPICRERCKPGNLVLAPVRIWPIAGKNHSPAFPQLGNADSRSL